MLLIATCKNTKNSIFLKLKNPITMHIAHVIGFLFLLKIREIFIFNIMFTAFIKILPVGELAAHSHTASSNTTGEHNHGINARAHNGADTAISYFESANSDRTYYTNNAVGELPAHNHTASTNTTGNHTHQFQLYGPNGNTNMNFPSDFDTNYARNKGTTLSAGNHSHTININNTGSSQSHNNMQPYLTVYMWKRTA